MNYSETERECYAIVWAFTTIRSYIEDTNFTVRTDHDSLKWLLFLTESFDGLKRWRFRLSEFDFYCQYCSGRTLSTGRVVTVAPTKSAADAQRAVNEEVPTFEVVNVLRPFSDGSEIFVKTSRKKQQASAPSSPDSPRDQEKYTTLVPVSIPVSHSPLPPDAASETEAAPDFFNEGACDGCDDNFFSSVASLSRERRVTLSDGALR